MRNYIALLLLVFLLSCSIQTEKAPQDIPLTRKKRVTDILPILAGLIVSEIPIAINKGYTVKIAYKGKLDNFQKEDLEYWATKDTTNFSPQEKLLLMELTQKENLSLSLEFDKLENNTKSELEKSNQESERMCTFYFGNIAFNQDTTLATTLLGTYFTSKDPEGRRRTGGEEIVIFEKANTTWTIKKRLATINY